MGFDSSKSRFAFLRKHCLSLYFFNSQIAIAITPIPPTEIPILSSFFTKLLFVQLFDENHVVLSVDSNVDACPWVIPKPVKKLVLAK